MVNDSTKKEQPKDVDMADAAPAVKPEPTPAELNNLLVADLKKNISLLEKTVSTKETRISSRVLRSISAQRRKLNSEVLRTLIEQVFDDDSAIKQQLLQSIKNTDSSAMDTTSTSSSQSDSAKRSKVLPEAEVYVRLLIVIFLIDRKLYDQAIVASESLVQRLQDFNRRTLNPLSAKVYFYYARAYELSHRLEEIRSKLFAYYRTASLRHNDEAQATLLNLLLRNYLEYNLYDQADKLVSMVSF